MNYSEITFLHKVIFNLTHPITMIIVIFVTYAESFAQDEFFLKKIVENGATVTETAGARIIKQGVEYLASRNMILHTGDCIKVLSPDVTVTVQSIGHGQEVSYGKTPATYCLGATQERTIPFKQTSGRVSYRVFLKKITNSFRSLLGPPERTVPVEVEGTIFSVDIDENNIEIVVTEGRIRIGEPGTALYRQIDNGRFMNVAPNGQMQQGRARRETIIRINNEVSEISISEVFDADTSEKKVLADPLLPRREFFAARTGGAQFRQTRLILPRSQTPAQRDSAIAQYREGGARIVEVNDPLQCWAYADYAYQTLGEVETAKKFYLLAVNKSEGREKKELYYNLGAICLESSQIDEAEKYLQQCIALEPKDVSALLLVSRLYVQIEDFAQLTRAQDYLLRALTQDSLSTENLYLAGVIADRLNQPRKAFFLFRSALRGYADEKATPMQGLCLWGMGDARYSLLDAAGALRPYQRMHAIFDSLRQAAPNRPELARYLAIASNKLGDALSLMGQENEAARRYTEALTLRQSLIQAYPDDREISHELAISLERAGDLHHKRNDLEKAAGFYQQALEIRLRLFGAADTTIEQAQALLTAYNKLGNIFLEIGERSRVIEFYSKALAIREKLAGKNPRDLPASAELALSYAHLGGLFKNQPDSALSYYEKALRIQRRLAAADPARIDFLQNLAEFNYLVANLSDSLHQFSRAVEHYAEAASIVEKLYNTQPQQKSLALRLARTYERLADYDSAAIDNDQQRTFLHKALAARKQAVNPQDEKESDDLEIARLANKLAGAWFQAQRPDSAKTYLMEAVERRERSLAKHPDNVALAKDFVDVLYNLGMLLTAQARSRAEGKGYLKKAEALLEKFKEKDGIQGTDYERLLEEIRRELARP